MDRHPEPLTLPELQAQVDAWIRTVGVRYFSELTNLAILTEEVGELARIISRRYGEQSAKHAEDVSPQRLAEELTDVLFVLVCLANQTGTDLSQAWQQGMQKRSTRDATRHKENPKLQPGG